MGKEITVDQAVEEISIASSNKLPFLSLNHVSFVCKSVRRSVEFYERVLGFVLIKRPSSFDFEGAWLFNHGIGIHLLQGDSKAPQKADNKINPKDNHISFQCTDMELLITQLDELKIKYVKAVVREEGITVDQIFFHDPDGYMIEICNCQNLPVLPITSSSSSSSCPIKKTTTKKKKIMSKPSSSSSFYGKSQCGGEAEAAMMENLTVDMMNISI